MKGPTEVKGPTSVNFKQGGDQNDGATVECSMLVLLQIQLAILCF